EDKRADDAADQAGALIGPVPQPIAWPMNVATNAPAMPRSVVRMKPAGSFDPGASSRDQAGNEADDDHPENMHGAAPARSGGNKGGGQRCMRGPVQASIVSLWHRYVDGAAQTTIFCVACVFESPAMTKTIVAPRTKTKTKPNRPPLYKVILLNDDYTPREFVVLVLKAVFRMSGDQAYRVMMTAHQRGACVIAVYTRDVAETKAKEGTELGKSKGY